MRQKEEELNHQIGETLQDKDEQLVTIEQIENTPFALVTILDRGSFIAIGNNRLTEYFPTKEMAIDEIDNHSWEFLLSVIVTLFRTLKDMNIEEVTITEEIKTVTDRQ